MTVSFNDQFASDLHAEFPRHGAWYADVTFMGPGAPKQGTVGTLKVDDISWSGTAVSSTKVEPGRWQVRIIGGAGQMSQSTGAKNLTDTDGKRVINELLTGTTETLGEVSPPSIRSYAFKQWQLLDSVPRGKQLSRLIERFTDAVWRVGRDGKLTITQDSSPGTAKLPKGAILTDSWSDGSLVYQLQNLTSWIEPGQLINGDWKVECVNIDIDPKRTTMTLLRQSLSSAIDVVASRNHRNALQSCYPCRVEGQNADGPRSSAVGGTLRLTPDDPRIRGAGLDKVPIRCVANMLLQVPVGARCFVQYDAEDPGRPFVSGFEQAINGDFLHVHGDPTSAQFVALANLVKAELDSFKADLDALKSTFDGHTHPYVDSPVGAATTSPTTTSAPTPHTPGEVAALKLKTQ
jgi:hypothetical protein